MVRIHRGLKGVVLLEGLEVVFIVVGSGGAPGSRQGG